MAAAVQRNAIEGELQRFTLRVTRRTVPIMFSMMLVQASELRSSAGRPSLLTVSIFEALRAARVDVVEKRGPVHAFIEMP